MPDSSNSNVTYMRLALAEARKSPPKPTNFCVGAVLVSPTVPPTVITGYTLELPGNTHAEQCCFLKLNAPETPLPSGSVLYTTMEPCNKRSVGNKPCVDRILEVKDGDGRLAIKTVYVGVLEPETFVGVNEGRKRLEQAGIEVVKVEAEGLEEEILSVATAGHVKGDETRDAG